MAQWSAPAVHEVLSGLATAKGVSLGKLAQPIRIAICGGTVSPPIDASLAILGQAESLSRLTAALCGLEKRRTDCGQLAMDRFGPRSPSFS